MGALAFDRVVISKTGGPPRQYSATEFLNLTFAERIQHILRGKLQFFLGAQPVEPEVALKSLRGFALKKQV